MKNIVALAAAWVMVTAGAATAQTRDQAFNQGMDAYDNKRWTELVAHMRRALAADAKESRQKIGRRLGGVLGGVLGGGTEYLPYFFLGVGHHESGECSLALAAWSASQQQRVIEGIPERLQILRAGSAECEKKGFLPSPKFEAAVANATRQISEVNDVAGTVSSRAGDAGELFTPERRGQYEQAANEITEAQARLDAGKKSRLERDLAEVGNATGRARMILVGLSESLEAAITNRNSALGELAEVGRAIQGAEALDREIETRKVVLNDALNGTRQLGRQALSRARGRLPDGSRSPTIQSSAAIADARRDVQIASNHFTQILEELRRLGQQDAERRLTLLLRSARDMFAFVDDAFDTFDRRAAARSEKVDTTERQTIERRVQAARRQLDLATKSGDVGSIEAARRSAEQARDRLNVLISAFGPLSLVDRGVHPALERGAQLFLTGEHQQTLDALSPAEPFLPDMPLLLHVHLFRAAALHGLYLRSGASDSSLRDRAQTETAMVKALDRGFQPDPRVFSPRFLEFFRAISQPDETPVGPGQP